MNKKYKLINNITGWLIFGISASVYLYTMEPTVSLWDCGEFISAADKLEVGHPPGAPLYLMLARIFALFAADKSSIALCINSLSALASAFTVMFLFWTITQLARRVIIKGDEVLTSSGIILIIGSGVVGAFAFSFSDSFWFSAAEAEVYALSSLFTALVFWSILKWEEDSGRYSNRWLVFIAYLMGLSIGVHLLNLLAIPAVGLIIYFRKYRFSWRAFLMAILVSILVLLFILYLFLPGTIKLAAVFERIVVNEFQWPVNAGMAVFIIFIVQVFILLLYITYRNNLVIWNTVILFSTFLLIGFCSYAMIVIRAQADPPLNTGNPSNAYSLLSYLKRDQYGDAPLVYGKYYNAPVKSITSIEDYYLSKDQKYKKGKTTKVVSYDADNMTLFPRMYSANPDHIEVYRNWGTIKESPTFSDNLEFFFKYQIGYMYLRYFLWNFSGKQNDMQGNGGILRGNWISGFDFIDLWFIGPQNALPDYLKNNPGRNRYFLLPLLLGALGMLFHYKQNRRYFTAILFLFLMTSIGIVIYTNQTPLQPRERDYVYVGSFYAFSIWIGIGTISLVQRLARVLSGKFALMLGIGGGLIIPGLMFSQNVDDHNRHGRYIIRNIASNYLNSCDANSILFTAGDNDTYPLWYLQEVENIRTDIRVVNLMLLNADWYAEQQKRKQYTSSGVPMKLNYNSERGGVLVSKSGNYFNNLKEVLQHIKKQYKNSEEPTISSRLYLPLGSDSALLRFSTSYLRRSELAVLDILANQNSGRQVYFTIPDAVSRIDLRPCLTPVGFVFKLQGGNMETNIRDEYNLLVRNAEWNGGKGLVDDHVRKMMTIMNVRQNYARLGIALADEGKLLQSEEVLDRVMQIMPLSKFPLDPYSLDIAEGYFKAGFRKKAEEILNQYALQLKQEEHFYRKLKPWMWDWVGRERATTRQNLLQVYGLLKKYKNGL